MTLNNSSYRDVRPSPSRRNPERASPSRGWAKGGIRAPGRAGTTARAALICHHNDTHGTSAEWTTWDTRDQADHVQAELTPRGPRCLGVHSFVVVGADNAPTLEDRLIDAAMSHC